LKALVVLSQPPLAEGGAPGRVAIGLLRGLLEHGVDVRAIAARRHFAVAGDPPADLPVEIVDVPAEAASWRLRADQVRHPRGELARGPFVEAVRAASRDADVLHLEETETAWCDLGLDIPSLVHLHYRITRDQHWPRLWSRRFRRMAEFALAERLAIRRHRYLVASSPLVAAELPGDVTLAPLSLDPALYASAPLDGPPTAGLIGTGTWGPTAAARRRLVERVWPRVRERVPEARLLVAGRGWGELGGPGVEFLGEVASGREFLRGLSVLVFPLDRGSGMKVKVLEAIASGVPVVTTPAGAEGIEPTDGVIVATDDHALAAAGAAILSDGANRSERGGAARAAFERGYTPKVATAPLVSLYERMRSRA
jgi:glycosyltransferase involved in cell wall biosynthesis